NEAIWFSVCEAPEAVAQLFVFARPSATRLSPVCPSHSCRDSALQWHKSSETACHVGVAKEPDASRATSSASDLDRGLAESAAPILPIAPSDISPNIVDSENRPGRAAKHH